jgi:hypothetical protein
VTDDGGETVIYGHDDAGWTLDGYVLPRLASGLLFATEVEPDDPRFERLRPNLFDAIQHRASDDDDAPGGWANAHPQWSGQWDADSWQYDGDGYSIMVDWAQEADPTGQAPHDTVFIGVYSSSFMEHGAGRACPSTSAARASERRGPRSSGWCATPTRTRARSCPCWWSSTASSAARTPHERANLAPAAILAEDRERKPPRTAVSGCLKLAPGLHYRRQHGQTPGGGTMDGVNKSVSKMEKASDTLSGAMTDALRFLRAEGVVFAGANVTRRGSVVRVAASTLRALERRDLCTLSVGPDGGIMARFRDEDE